MILFGINVMPLPKRIRSGCFFCLAGSPEGLEWRMAKPERAAVGLSPRLSERRD